MIPAVDYRFPVHATIKNVKDYGALGNGVADDTAAIQSAINAAVTGQFHLVFPKGTYLVSGPLQGQKSAGNPAANFKIFGENRDQTIIKLKDGSTGYQDPTTPQYVLRFNSDSNSLTTWATLGEGNQAFANYLEHVTVDTGNNPGAVAVDYIGNNHAAIRDVLIRAGGTGAGVAGLSMMRQWPGPSFVKNVRIEGFDYAVKSSQYQYSITFEHIEIANQKLGGFWNEKNQINIRDLVATNANPAVPVFTQNNPYGQFTAIDINCGGMFIQNQDGQMFLRNITNVANINNKGTVTNGPTITEWTSSAPATLFTGATGKSLNMAVEEPTDFYTNDFTQWANVLDYGAQVSGGTIDASPGIQAAMNSGKPVVWFPFQGSGGQYYLASSIIIPPSVKLVVGMNSQMLGKSASGFTDGSNRKPLFRCQNTSDLTLWRLRMAKSTLEAQPGMVCVQQEGGNVFLKDMNMSARDDISPAYMVGPAVPGKLFGENCTGTRYELSTKAQKVYMRSWNGESNALKIDNRGAYIWAFGFKTEGTGPNGTFTNQSRVEMLGGFWYPTGTPPAGTIAFVCNYSTFCLNFAEIAYASTAVYNDYVQETSYDGGFSATRDLLHSSSALPGRGFGKFCVLYTSVDAGTTAPPSQYAIVFSDPIGRVVSGQNILLTYEVVYKSPDKEDTSTVQVSMNPGDTAATMASKLQSAVTTEGTRIGLTLVPANILMPAVTKGT